MSRLLRSVVSASVLPLLNLAAPLYPSSVTPRSLPAHGRVAQKGARLAGLLLSAVMLAALLPSIAMGLPVAVIKEPSYNFNSVTEGTPVEHDYTIENRGDSVLEIRKIRPACGCTAAVVASEKIKPGESTLLKVRFDTSGFSGFKVKNVRIYTNDPNHSSLVLTMQGTVEPPVLVEPPRANFGSIRKGSVVSEEIFVSSAGRGIEIVGIRPRSEFIKVERSSAGERTRLLISIAENAPIGVFRSRVAIQTNSSEVPLVNIPVFAKIRGDLALSTSAVSFGLVEGPVNTPLLQEVDLVNHSENPIAILSAVSDHPNISVEVSPLAEGKKFKITVGLSGRHVGALRAKINITTDHEDPAQKQVILPVYGIISRSSS